MKRVFLISALLSVMLSACGPKMVPSDVQGQPEVSTTLPESVVPLTPDSNGDGVNVQTALPQSITMTDNGKTFSAKVGDSFLLNLGADVYNWEVSVDNQNVLALKMGVMVVKGAQGIYDVLQPGTAILTAVGDPLCRQTAPPCGMPSVLFKITVVVQ